MYNLSSAQQNIWNLQKYYRDSTISAICGAIFFKEKLNGKKLEKAINYVIEHQCGLRLRFFEVNGKAMQEVTDYQYEEIPILRFSDKETLHQYVLQYAKKLTDLTDRPLYHFAIFHMNGQTGIVTVLSHIISDAWTLSLLAGQVSKAYWNLCQGTPCNPQVWDYLDYIQAEEDYLTSAHFKKDTDYWRKKYLNKPELTAIKLYSSSNMAITSKRVTRPLSSKLTELIDQFCKKNGISPAVLFEAGVLIYLSKINPDNKTVTIGTPILGRHNIQEKNTVGMFISTMPLTIPVSAFDTVEILAGRIADSHKELFRHQRYPYSNILRQLRENDDFTGNLYEVMVSFQNAQTGVNAETEWFSNGYSEVPLALHIDNRDNGSNYTWTVDYQTEVFHYEAEVQLIIDRLEYIFQQILTNYKIRISEISIIPDAEYKQILFDFNDTAIDYPRDKCVHTVFEEQVERTPDKTAVIACDRTLTYRELNEEANRIAHGLMEKGVEVGDIVAFALPRDSHLIPTMFGILKAGAAYLPIDPDYPLERKETLLRESQAKCFIVKDSLALLLACEPIKRSIVCSDLYCALHTSGSTGTPKLSTLTHHGILSFFIANTHWYQDICSVCAFTIYTFDLFILETVIPLLHGVPVALANENEIYNQANLEALLGKHPQALISATPTKLKQYIQGSIHKDVWKNVTRFIIGGEVFSEELLTLIQSINESAEVINIYGPAETTICSTTMIVKPDDITIGKPIANTQIYIVNRLMQPVPIGITGELCIAGDGVGAGYLNRPELTAEKFIDNPFGVGNLYKTGDLAYWREDGNIVYVGRNDFQVKIRGLRIELGEIESAIAGVDGVAQAVVVVRKDETGRQLICAFYTGEKQDTGVFRAAIVNKLPKYMLPHIFTHLDVMPLTSSGKINRIALPEVNWGRVSSVVEYVAPKNERETALCIAVQSVLHIEKVSMADSFFDLGGDSLKAIELIAGLEQVGYSVEVKDIFTTDTLRELTEKLTTATEQFEIEIPTGPIPATPAQMRVYTAHAKQGGTLYNVPYAFEAKEAIDIDRLQNAIAKMIERHESLRTHFENKDGSIMQVVDKTAICKVEMLHSGNIVDFVREFDLSSSPLLHVGVYERTVLFDMHHIITDGTSISIFIRELNELYMGRELPPVEAHYRQFAVEAPNYTESESYWLTTYAGELPVLELNTDFHRGQNRIFDGSIVYDTIETTLHKKIITFCKAKKITPYVFYLAGFYVLLSKFSGNEDVIVGIPVSGRSTKYLNSMGMFVNTVALRGQPEGDKTVKEFLQEVKRNSSQAIHHQGYPFGELVKKLNIDSSVHNPLFDVMFAYQNEMAPDTVFGDIKAKPLPVQVQTSKYDFTLNILPMYANVILAVEYCTGLYKENTVHRWINSYKQLLEQMLFEQKILRDITVLTKDEYQRVLFDFNDNALDYPRDKCVHTLFEEQAAKTPDRTAVVACDRTLTYRELNNISNQIAHGLISQGVKPGNIVAFALPRKSYLIATMFGILKAGAAYLPIDPDYPRDRIEYMLKDSKAVCFVTENNILGLLNNKNNLNPAISLDKTSKYCVIYTSGSTGTPKGCVLLHQGVCNFCENSNVIAYFKRREIEPKGISVNNVTFDYFIAENMVLLLHGYTTVLCNETESVSPDDFWSLCEMHKINLIQTTPTKYRIMLETPSASYLKSVNLLVSSGEPLTRELIKKISHYTNAGIFNPLGPSEATIWSPNGENITSTDIHIGKPLANTQVYILDKYLYPVPIGVTGELCIAGDGVGAGYLNRPELTAEKFINNPFGEGKLYKTGDLAYWRTDGNIVYVGRNDFQVKIRGLRIELGEIESAMQGVEGITQAVVVVRKNEDGRQLICAFYTGSEIPAKDIRNQIGQKLPKYMLPHIFTHLDVMPLTSSGKINRNSLPEVNLGIMSNVVGYVAPVDELEKHLASIMEQVLNYSPIGRNDDFFDLGGDSLTAIEFLSKAHGEKIYFDLQNVFDYPTVKALCGYLQHRTAKESSFRPEQFVKYAPILKQNEWDERFVPEPHKIGTVFLTGGTGFLGAHIINALIKHDAQKIYCLVRSNKGRLIQRLQYYFGKEYLDKIGGKIIPIVGDLESEQVGADWPEQVDYVIHAAASVKHYGSWEYFRQANVEATSSVLSYAQRINAKLVYVSTTSISGNSMADQFDGYISEEEKHFYENSLYIGQPLDNVYVRSKFKAETIILDAMCSGFHANIVRMGNLTNRISDMKFQPNYDENAFLKHIKAILDLGCLPDYLKSTYAEFTPVDAAAEAITKIVEYMNDKYTIFHVNSNRNLYFDKMLKYVAQAGHPLLVLSGTEFSKRIRATLSSSQKYIYESLSNHLNSDDVLQYDSNIHIENGFTVQYLQSLGFFWPEIDYSYIERYLRYFEELGYIGGKANGSK